MERQLEAMERGTRTEDRESPRSDLKKMPAMAHMKEGTDVQDYLDVFEDYMTVQGIPKTKWAIHLKPLMNDECRAALGAMGRIERGSYDNVKEVLLATDKPRTSESLKTFWSLGNTNGQTLQIVPKEGQEFVRGREPEDAQAVIEATER